MPFEAAPNGVIGLETAFAAVYIRGDSILTAVAALLAIISLEAWRAAQAFGLWWADAIAALIVAVIVLREGWNSLRSVATRPTGVGSDRGPERETATSRTLSPRDPADRRRGASARSRTPPGPGTPHEPGPRRPPRRPSSTRARRSTRRRVRASAASGSSSSCSWSCVILTPIGVAGNWPDWLTAALLFITLVLLLVAGQTVIFLLRLVAADRRGRPRARWRAADADGRRARGRRGPRRATGRARSSAACEQ